MHFHDRTLWPGVSLMTAKPCWDALPVSKSLALALNSVPIAGWPKLADSFGCLMERMSSFFHSSSPKGGSRKSMRPSYAIQDHVGGVKVLLAGKTILRNTAGVPDASLPRFHSKLRCSRPCPSSKMPNPPCVCRSDMSRLSSPAMAMGRSSHRVKASREYCL